jgi:tetratricopeptide (TPR) repeat protein
LLMINKEKIWLAAWGYYIVTLMPVLGIVQVGGQSMADRYMYLPSLGPFLVIGVLTAGITKKIESKNKFGFMPKLTYFTIISFLFVILSYLTIAQIGIWRTSVDLWTAVIKKEPNRVPLAYYNRGQAFMNLGEFDKAIEDYSTAAKLNSSYYQAFYNRGVAFEKIGQPNRAIADYERTISLNPSSYQAYNNCGILYGNSGAYQKAIEFFNQAIAINSAYPSSYFNRGFTLSLVGQFDKALADYNTTIELDQRFALAYLYRGKLHLQTHNRLLAIADFREACKLGIREACNNIP